MSKERKANIRNSTAEFLIFTGQPKENSIEVRVAEESVWLTQKLMSTLFEVSVPTINEHLSNLFIQNEIPKEATIRNFRIVQKEGSREEGQEAHYMAFQGQNLSYVENSSKNAHINRICSFGKHIY